jgi:hypothetical protein
MAKANACTLLHAGCKVSTPCLLSDEAAKTSVQTVYELSWREAIFFMILEFSCVKYV